MGANLRFLSAIIIDHLLNSSLAHPTEFHPGAGNHQTVHHRPIETLGNISGAFESPDFVFKVPVPVSHSLEASLDGFVLLLESGLEFLIWVSLRFFFLAFFQSLIHFLKVGPPLGLQFFQFLLTVFGREAYSRRQ